jgi:hypothetical protein
MGAAIWEGEIEVKLIKVNVSCNLFQPWELIMLQGEKSQICLVIWKKFHESRSSPFLEEMAISISFHIYITRGKKLINGSD